MAKIEYHRDRGNYRKYTIMNLLTISTMRYMNTVKKRASQMHLMHLSRCRYISATSMQYEHRPYR